MTSRWRSFFFFAPPLTVIILICPVLAGFLGTLAPAFGWLPTLGGETLSLQPWRDLFATPGIDRSIMLSLFVGLASTLLSLLIALAICASLDGTYAFALVRRALSPLLSIPHAATAFGLAFLLSPSGWISRFLSPWATGWERPPDWLIIHDPWGLSMIAGLVVKEVPFLLLMMLAALAQIDARKLRSITTSLGYGSVSGWLKAIFPALYPQIKLPVYAVLAYAMGNVDVALILGPTRPAPLSVQLIEWMRDPDLTLWFRAAAGAVLQVVLVLGALVFWRCGEVLARRVGLFLSFGGGRNEAGQVIRPIAIALAMGLAGSVAFGLLGLVLWSVAGFWTFPQALPEGLSLRIWRSEAPEVLALYATTYGIAVAACSMALVLVVACLEAERRFDFHPGRHALWLLYVPLIMPQTGFLFGMQIFAAASGLDVSVAAVIGVHLIFVLPYVYIALSGPYRAWNPRYGLAALSLGASRDATLWRVKLPMLLAALLTACAVGIAVSIGQYLPTLLIGGGRVETLTTQAVALSASGNRRLIGLYGLMQTLAPLPAFVAALAVPAFVFRNRRALQVAP